MGLHPLVGVLDVLAVLSIELRHNRHGSSTLAVLAGVRLPAYVLEVFEMVTGSAAVVHMALLVTADPNVAVLHLAVL